MKRLLNISPSLFKSSIILTLLFLFIFVAEKGQARIDSDCSVNSGNCPIENVSCPEGMEPCCQWACGTRGTNCDTSTCIGSDCYSLWCAGCCESDGSGGGSGGGGGSTGPSCTTRNFCKGNAIWKCESSSSSSCKSNYGCTGWLYQIDANPSTPEMDDCSYLDETLISCDQAKWQCASDCSFCGGFPGFGPGLPGSPGYEEAPGFYACRNPCYKLKYQRVKVGYCENASCKTKEQNQSCPYTSDYRFYCPYSCTYSSAIGEATCLAKGVVDIRDLNANESWQNIEASLASTQPKSSFALFQGIAPIGGTITPDETIDVNEHNLIEFSCIKSDDPDKMHAVSGASDTRVESCEWYVYVQGTGGLQLLEQRTLPADQNFRYAFEITPDPITGKIPATKLFYVKMVPIDAASVSGLAVWIAVNVSHINLAPVAKLSITPSEGTVGVTEFTLDATASYDPDGIIVSYEWDLNGDGIADISGIAYSKIENYKFDVSGNVQVTLCVEDDNGAIDCNSQIVKLNNNAPVAGFVAVPMYGVRPVKVIFTSNAKDPDGHAIASYAWDFENDGSVDSTSKDVMYEYTQSGDYNAVLTVCDIYGACSSVWQTISVYDLNSVREVVARDVNEGDALEGYAVCAPQDASVTVSVERVLSNTVEEVLSTGNTSVACNDVDELLANWQLNKGGVYRLTVRIANCTLPECMKSTLFNVFSVPKAKAASENGIIIGIVALFTLVMLKRKKAL